MKSLCSLAFVSLFLALTAFAQQPNNNHSLQPVDSNQSISGQSSPAQNSPQDAAPTSSSLADQARKLRKEHPPEVKMTDEQTRQLFSAVDKIFDFASTDTGYAKRSAIRRPFRARRTHHEKVRPAPARI